LRGAVRADVQRQVNRIVLAGAVTHRRDVGQLLVVELPSGAKAVIVLAQGVQAAAVRQSMPLEDARGSGSGRPGASGGGGGRPVKKGGGGAALMADWLSAPVRYPRALVLPTGETSTGRRSLGREKQNIETQSTHYTAQLVNQSTGRRCVKETKPSLARLKRVFLRGGCITVWVHQDNLASCNSHWKRPPVRTPCAMIPSLQVRHSSHQRALLPGP